MASIQTDGITLSNGIHVNFQPWFASGYRFTSLHIYEELGGYLADGQIDLQIDGTGPSLDLLQNQKTGNLSISQVTGGFSYEIPVSVTNVIHHKNFVTLEFKCISLLDFAQKNQTVIWEKPIKDTIKALYPGKVDIRDGCEPDLNPDPSFYWQDHETNHSLCTKLCFAYKKDSIFSFSWEGLLIKDTMGNKSSWGKPDGHIEFRGDTSEATQDNDYARPHQPYIYRLPINVWEDTKPEVAIKDYTKYESPNLRVIKKYDKYYYMHKDYYQMDYNMSYNSDYLRSTYFQELRIMNDSLPNYKIGDVLWYQREPIIQEQLSWPWKYYLVRSNELFIATDSSEVFDEHGAKFGFVSRILALEEDGSIAFGKDTDPMEEVSA